MEVWYEDQLSTRFNVPVDAVAGDYFNVILQVRDEAEHPMERYAQVIITVVD